MTTADRIGLRGYWAWLTDLPPQLTFLYCIIITPVALMIIAPVLESRWLPLSPHKQFLSFFPGDMLLGEMAAWLLLIARDLPDEARWYNSTIWHALVQISALLIAGYLTYCEYIGGMYPKRAILSPTKIYHNFALYGGYGYLIFTTLIAVLFGSEWTPLFLEELAFVFIPGLAWVALLIEDNTLPGSINEKAQYAHVADWRPIWKRRRR